MLKNHFIYIFLILIFSGCSKPDPQSMKNYLSGYWEIEEVEFPDGEKKKYDMSLVIDYIEITGEQGKRTKVSPEIDGSFSTNGVSEDFTLNIEDDNLYMLYKTPFDEWKETVLKAKDSVLVVKNRDDKIYRYKKYVPLNLSDLKTNE